ncbi:UNVERIFIED_CONTAM: Auxin-responsive protein SAUR50 [Sesamum radiatum]
MAVDDDELKRFVVPLSFLTHPSFLRLLEQAAEEYGFDHDGALTVPCRPTELERILAEQWAEERVVASGGDDHNWGSCNKTMVKSC